jgi:hypothetical protein
MTDLDFLDLDLDLNLDNYLLHPQPQHNLRIVHAFMQSDRTIEHVCEETVPIENGTLSQEKLIWRIKQQQQRQREQCGRHFKLRAMFLYNMDLQAADVQDFLRANDNEHRFLVPIAALENVVVKPSIPMFARLNALHIVYEGSAHAHAHAHAHSKKRVIRINSLPHKRKGKHTRRH